VYQFHNICNRDQHKLYVLPNLKTELTEILQLPPMSIPPISPMPLIAVLEGIAAAPVVDMVGMDIAIEVGTAMDMSDMDIPDMPDMT
jgi:hypothetical protein